MQTYSPRSARRLMLACSFVLIFAMLAVAMPTAALAAPASSPNYSGTYYWVQPGDTLSEIAVWHGTTVHALMQANGLHNPNHIYVGQRLYIPGGYGGGHGGPVGGPQCAYYHTVQYGQTLSHIAAYYGVNPYTLAQVNAIYNWNHIYAGQRLCIPGGYKPPYNPPPHHPKPHPKPEPPQPQPTYCTYTVRYGDTLEKIAWWYGTTTQHLVALNNLYNTNQLYVGQVLYVPGQNCQPRPEPPQPQPPADGWTGTYFNNKYFEGSPVLVRQDGAVNFDWGGGGPGNGVPDDRFSVIWERSTYVKAGTYRFYAMSDDGVRVFVDGHLIIDQWNEHPTQSYFGDIYLGEGQHSLRVEYYEEGGVANIRVWWDRL
ncbi:MAG TPA: LysM peptidoglycan-binding domain-containing protein [Caldilineaceae bacterium]|nr:LysM peptidoglycan-binding domain-containing protein [Caldilineaceae bacterium]